MIFTRNLHTRGVRDQTGAVVRQTLLELPLRCSVRKCRWQFRPTFEGLHLPRLRQKFCAFMEFVVVVVDTAPNGQRSLKHC
jgi:hypothetical protein